MVVTFVVTCKISGERRRVRVPGKGSRSKDQGRKKASFSVFRFRFSAIRFNFKGLAWGRGLVFWLVGVLVFWLKVKSNFEINGPAFGFVKGRARGRPSYRGAGFLVSWLLVVGCWFVVKNNFKGLACGVVTVVVWSFC